MILFLIYTHGGREERIVSFRLAALGYQSDISIDPSCFFYMIFFALKGNGISLLPSLPSLHHLEIPPTRIRRRVERIHWDLLQLFASLASLPLVSPLHPQGCRAVAPARTFFSVPPFTSNSAH